MSYQANRTFATAGIGRVRRGEIVNLSPGVARVLLARGTVSEYNGPSVQPVVEPSEIKPLGTTGTYIARCGDCGKTFDSSRGLSIHVGSVHKAYAQDELE
jgi:hypothetical protein